MGHRALYEFTDETGTTYAYAHWGSSVATGLYRYSEAVKQFEADKAECATVAQYLICCDYDGNYHPRTDIYDYNSDMVFNPISSATACSMYKEFYSVYGDIEAVVKINSAENTYSYKNRSFAVKLPLDTALEIAQEKLDERDYKSIYDYGNVLGPALVEKSKGLNKFSCVVVEPGLSARTEYIDGSLRSLQSLVGGYIEPLYAYSDSNDVIFVGNDEARIMELEPNRKFEGKQALCGPFVIVGNGEEDFCSLTDEQCIEYCEKFAQPDKFSAAERAAAHRISYTFVPYDNPEQSATVAQKTKGKTR